MSNILTFSGIKKYCSEAFDGMSKARKYGSISGIIAILIVPFLDMASLIFKASEVTTDPLSITATNIALKLIMGLFLFGIVQLIAKWQRFEKIADSIPSHLTGIGILGTFVGIFIGLYKFDVNNLGSSVPLLLEGMKVAFSTSIAGLVASTSLKLAHTFIISIFIGDDSRDSEEDNRLNPANAMGNVNISDIGLIMAMEDAEFNELIERFKKLRKVENEIIWEFIAKNSYTAGSYKDWNGRF
ncbi:MAG: hypothetical protein HZC51_13265 [Nitrospirae bacterium]|nr:hypothetical protein [Nitrospirota bacterium]